MTFCNSFLLLAEHGTRDPAYLWLGGVVVSALDLEINRSRIRFLIDALTGSIPGQVVHTVPSVSEVTTVWCHRNLVIFIL